MGHTYCNILLHFIFSTKERNPWINDELQSRLYAYIGGIVREEKGVLLEAGGTDDHIHLLVSWRTDETVANLMREVKAHSSGWVHDTFAQYGHFSWQEGYGVFSVSESQKERVRSYVRNQENHHREKTFKEEFVEFLDKHGYSYDERYIWK